MDVDLLGAPEGYALPPHAVSQANANFSQGYHVLPRWPSQPSSCPPPPPHSQSQLSQHSHLSQLASDVEPSPFFALTTPPPMHHAPYATATTSTMAGNAAPHAHPHQFAPRVQVSASASAPAPPPQGYAAPLRPAFSSAPTNAGPAPQPYAYSTYELSPCPSPPLSSNASAPHAAPAPPAMPTHHAAYATCTLPPASAMMQPLSGPSAHAHAHAIGHPHPHPHPHGEATHPHQLVSLFTPPKAPQKWTPVEDEMLRQAVATLGCKKWKLVAQHVPGRSHIQCLQRWNKVLKPGIKKGAWTEEEDELVRKSVDDQTDAGAVVNWAVVAQAVQGRTAKQCRERWRCNLDPSICKSDWTREEDEMLVALQRELGNRWALISKSLPGRTENAIKTRFRSFLRAEKKKWRPNEDAVVRQHLMGLKTLDEALELLPGRTRTTLRRRAAEMRDAMGYPGSSSTTSSSMGGAPSLSSSMGGAPQGGFPAPGQQAAALTFVDDEDEHENEHDDEHDEEDDDEDEDEEGEAHPPAHPAHVHAHPAHPEQGGAPWKRARAGEVGMV